MKSVLEELFYGNVCPNTDCRSNTKETNELMGYIAVHHDNLLATLTDKQKETLEKFNDCWSEYGNHFLPLFDGVCASVKCKKDRYTISFVPSTLPKLNKKRAVILFIC